MLRTLPALAFAAAIAAAAGAALAAPPTAKPDAADWIKHPVAVFTGLDKITGRATDFDVRVGETVSFYRLRVTPRVCFTTPPTERPRTDAFVQIDEITLQGKKKRIFSGWMFAASPGLNAVEHPIYDVWLKACKDGGGKAG